MARASRPSANGFRRSSLGSAIHHIGSTAVPGLAAKPIIDLMVLVEDLDAPIPALVERGGYQYPEAFNAVLKDRRWLCRPSPAHRSHHLHLVSDPQELERHLRFRDRLRADPALAAEYADLKRELADRHRDDREAYSAAKEAFVRRVESAREAHCSASDCPTEPNRSFDLRLERSDAPERWRSCGRSRPRWSRSIRRRGA